MVNYEEQEFNFIDFSDTDNVLIPDIIPWVLSDDDIERKMSNSNLNIILWMALWVKENDINSGNSESKNNDDVPQLMPQEENGQKHN